MRTNSLLLTALLLSLSAVFVPGAARGEESGQATGRIVGDPAHALGGGRLQDARRVPRHGVAAHSGSAAAPQDSAELPVCARPGRLRPAVSGALSRGGRRVPQICRRGTAPTRAGDGRHARREHARRRDIYSANPLRQRLLPRTARRRRHQLLAHRHLRASCPTAAAAAAGRLQNVLVLAWRAQSAASLGVSLAGNRRHTNSRVLAAAQLRSDVQRAQGSPPLRAVCQRPLRASGEILA